MRRWVGREEEVADGEAAEDEDDDELWNINCLVGGGHCVVAWLVLKDGREVLIETDVGGAISTFNVELIVNTR